MESTNDQITDTDGKPPVMPSAIERMSDEQLGEEQRVLAAEIEAAHERLSSVEIEIFYRKNPECRRSPN